jgi:manganese/iron transport system permease protein
LNELLLSLPAAALVGLICGLQSFVVVHRRLSFMSHGASHGMVAGVGLALLMHWPVFPLALLAALLISLGVGWITRKSSLGEDSAIGIMLSAFLAIGLLLAGVHGHAHGDDCGGGHLDEYLIGSLENVQVYDLFFLAALAVIVVALLWIYWRPLRLFLFDPEGARVAGYPVEFIRMSLLTALALTIALSMNVVGVLLVGAFLVIPASAAGFWSARSSRVMILAAVFSLIAALLGTLLSVAIHVPAGPTIVLALVALFLISKILGPEKA